MRPEASDELADPVVAAMFCSSTFDEPRIGVNNLKTATETMANGIAVEMVKPTRKPKYALADPKTMPKRMPAKTALKVKSRKFSVAAT